MLTTIEFHGNSQLDTIMDEIQLVHSTNSIDKCSMDMCKRSLRLFETNTRDLAFLNNFQLKKDKVHLENEINFDFD